MRGQRLYETPEWLHNRYWEEELSAKKMGALCHVGARTIKRHMEKNNIPLRSLSGARETCYGVSQYKNERWLRRKYWRQNLTLQEIAVLCSRDRKTVSAWMDELDIPRRTMVEARINRKRTHGTWYERLMEKVKAIITSLDSYMREKDN